MRFELRLDCFQVFRRFVRGGNCFDLGERPLPRPLELQTFRFPILDPGEVFIGCVFGPLVDRIEHFRLIEDVFALSEFSWNPNTQQKGDGADGSRDD